MDGFTLTGRLMEKKVITTKKGKQLDVIVIWAKNGLNSRAFEVIDWEQKVNGHQENTEISLPVSVTTSASKTGISYLNLGVQGEPLEIPRRQAD